MAMTDRQHSTPMQIFVKGLLRNSGAVVGGGIIVCFVLIALLADIVAPHPPNAQMLDYAIRPSMFRGSVLYFTNPQNLDLPTPIAVQSYSVRDSMILWTDIADTHDSAHVRTLYGRHEEDWHKAPLYIFGTDRYGRDILSRVMYGARISISIGLLSQFVSALIGISVGAFAGYYRGWIDVCLSWLMNVIWSFPGILLVIAFSVVLGQGFWQTCLAIGISTWVEIARMTRGQFLALREQEFAEAAKALGYSTPRIIFRHILPNAMGPIIIMLSAGFATAIISEAGLSFLGLGVQPPTASWGQMIRDGYGYIAAGINFGLTLYPGSAIALSVIAFNLLGDGVRDAFDIRSLNQKK